MILVVILWFFMPIDSSIAAPTVVNVKVGAGADDADEGYLGAFSLSDPTIDLGGIDRTVGLPFSGIDVPRCAKITTAYIEFTADASDSGAAVTTIAQSQSAGEGGGGLHAIPVNLPDIRVRVESWKHN